MGGVGRWMWYESHLARWPHFNHPLCPTEESKLYRNNISAKCRLRYYSVRFVRFPIDSVFFYSYLEMEHLLTFKGVQSLSNIIVMREISSVSHTWSSLTHEWAPLRLGSDRFLGSQVYDATEAGVSLSSTCDFW